MKRIAVAALLMASALVALGQERSREGHTGFEQAQVTLTRVVSVFTPETRGPDAISRSVMTHTTLATNSGLDAMEADSIVITDSIPTGGELLVRDIDAPGSGPVRFSQGATPSGLTYEYLGLASSEDDLMFSADSGATFEYAPTPGPRGTDPNVTHIRIHPKGAFAGRSGPGLPSFRLKFRVLRPQE